MNPEDVFLHVIYRIAEMRRQTEPWQVSELAARLGHEMPPGTFVTLEPPPPRPGSDHFLLGVAAKVDGVPSSFRCGSLEEDGRLCLFFDEVHSTGLEVGKRLELHRPVRQR